MHRRLPPVPLAALLFCACGGTAVPSASDDTPRGTPAPEQAQRSPTPASTRGVVTAETFATGLVNPWAIEFLPDGRALVTERPGRLRLVSRTGQLSAPLSGVPAVFAQGQGGLLDVALDPQFAQNQLLYLSFAESGEGGAGTAVARARFTEGGLQDVRVIYRQQPKLNGGGHYGSRLVFARDGRLFVTQGDRMNWKERAQDLAMGQGKIMRIATDGSVPADNPFAGRNDARAEIWSYGHRNVQAAALHPETGQLWTVEHGARGGDELNHPERGKNYGWPVITYGVDYSGATIGEGTAKAGMEQPVYYWDPVIAPSGMAFYTATAIPGWQNSVLIGSLSPGALVRLELRDGRVVREERYLGELGERIRDVTVGPDGFVYVVTDSGNGRVLRVRPMVG
ncbi:MAG: PQQ-dependent sugar dehydrogenase [Gemmatimonas sp.]|jgi:glucose/arabinose dehydrogenase|uniref:PQQ-dependent sugar dehydrogenase n=1 Tax=Gemmatimonas sp. TaxID=1962908 RepID=UPI00391F7FE2|nr:PQQ-dependent sugar dehydrogenase [Gemmatimonadota bacterium]